MSQIAANSALFEQMGSALSASYRFEHELAGGAMSRVIVATDRALGRRVVIKLLPDTGGAVDVDRFRLEIRLAAQLVHPHIVPLLSVGEVDGMLY